MHNLALCSSYTRREYKDDKEFLAVVKGLAEEARLLCLSCPADLDTGFMGKGGESDLYSERDDVADEYHDQSEEEVVGKVGVDEGGDAEAETGDGAEEEEGSDTEETEAHVRWGPSYGDDNSRFYSAAKTATNHFCDEVFDYL
ncbi:unnamed protein product, partial [Ectocarpus sp. 12 AP-2014]